MTPARRVWYAGDDRPGGKPRTRAAGARRARCSLGSGVRMFMIVRSTYRIGLPTMNDVSDDVCTNEHTFFRSKFQPTPRPTHASVRDPRDSPRDSGRVAAEAFTGLLNSLRTTVRNTGFSTSPPAPSILSCSEPHCCTTHLGARAALIEDRLQKKCSSQSALCRTRKCSSDDSRSRLAEQEPPFKHIFCIRRTRPCLARGPWSPPSTEQWPI